MPIEYATKGDISESINNGFSIGMNMKTAITAKLTTVIADRSEAVIG